MENSNQNETKNPIQKAAIPALLLIVLMALFYYKDSVLSFFNDKKASALAEVSVYKNDVRKKDSKSIDFKSTKKNEPIYHGDSLSTGASSSALVTFKSGQVLNVDQNSLIIFDELTDTPEFVKGNIKLTVKGKMKLKIENEIVEITGDQSDIQFFRDDKSKVQKIVLLKGNAQVKAPKQEVIALQQNIAFEAKKVFKADSIQGQREPSNQPSSLSILVPKAPVAPRGNYKLYDYYSRMLSSNSELGRNKSFTLKPNYFFEPFTAATVSFTALSTEDEDRAKNPFAFKIDDPSAAVGYVAEVSTRDDFADGETVYGWKSSYFSHNFRTPGTFYFRYRKVLPGQVLTDYSPTEKVSVTEKVQKPILAKLPEPAPVVEPVKVVPKPAPVVYKPAPAPVVLQKPAPAKRTIAAVEPKAEIKPQSMQSTVKTSPQDIIRNQNFHLSNVGLTASQSFLVSGRQLGNANKINTGYNLEVSGTHWINQQGFRASYNKTVTSQTASNLVTTAELSYLYRFNQPWSWVNGGSFQYYGSLGFENYQNSKSTSDFVDSYNLYKMGIGASMPIFNFWSVDGQFTYGFGDSKRSSIMFSTRANYFFTKTTSLGLGFRAKKYDYYLLNKPNYESLSETYTMLNMFY